MSRRKNKGYSGGSVWTHIGGSGFVDIHRGQREPTKTELISAYEDVVFSCINLIGQNIACTGLSLYGQDTRALRGKAISKLHLSALKKSPQRGLKLKSASQVEEITDHPLLDLLYKPNPSLQSTWYEFVQLIDAYLEVMGQSFVYIETNGLGLPFRLTVLPAHLVSVIPDPETGGIASYEYLPGLGKVKANYSIDEIIHFKYADLFNPYLDGFSPVRAIWERQLIGKKELSYLSNVFSNQSRMDAVVSPDQPLGRFESERLSKELTQRYRGNGAGGIFVAPDRMVVQPLAWSPRDTAGLEVYKVIKIATANAFNVPMPLLEPGSNRAESESAQYYLARYCLVPRMVRIAHGLNKLAEMFDERLWFEFDNPVPEDQELALQKRQQDLAEASGLAQTGSILPNELREKYGYPPTDWGEERLIPSNFVPASVHEQQHSPDPEPAPAPAPEPDKLNHALISQLQKDVYAGLLPREAAIQTVIVMGLDPQTAASLFPVVEPPEPPEPPEGDEDDEPEPPGEGELGAEDAVDGAETDEMDAKADTAGVDALAAVPVSDSKPPRKNLEKKMVATLNKYFRLQRQQIMQRLKAIDVVGLKAKSLLEPDDYKRERWEWQPHKKAGLELNVDLSGWSTGMAKDLLPLVVQTSREGQDAAAQRLGIQVPKVVQPKLKEALGKSTMKFCEETNATTSLQLQDAAAKLRDELEAGTVSGDGRNELRQRVQDVFDTASNDRAYRIAVTEQSRAISTGQKMVAEESGLVKGYRWVLSNDPCEICQNIAADNPEIPLDGVFAKINDDPDYGTIDKPPAHPHCFCSLQEILKD